MARFRRYLDIDVLTAARQRIRHIYDTHDRVVTCFSGGKDSLAVLELHREVAEARGDLPVNVIFRDEELIPKVVIDFVDEYRKKPWVKMYYFAVPLKSEKFVLGDNSGYVQWDPARRHIRPIPEHAIRLRPGDPRVFDQYTMDAFAATYFKGKLAFMTGVRAAESLIRFRACVNKLNDSYINASSSPRVSMCKPIYDWAENDVLKFFFEEHIRYCAIYDAQHLVGGRLRVSTPLHAEAAKKIGLLRRTDPVFYDQLIALFPDMAIQDRYWDELDREGLARIYGGSYASIRRYILEVMSPDRRAAALEKFDSAMVRARKEPASYPPAYVFRWIQTGAFTKELMAIGLHSKQAARRRT